MHDPDRGWVGAVELGHAGDHSSVSLRCLGQHTSSNVTDHPELTLAVAIGSASVGFAWMLRIYRDADRA